MKTLIWKEKDNLCHFDKEKITYLIDGGVEKTKYPRELGKKYLLNFKFLPFIY